MLYVMITIGVYNKTQQMYYCFTEYLPKMTQFYFVIIPTIIFSSFFVFSPLIIEILWL